MVPGYMRLMDFDDITNIDIDDPVMTTVGGLVFRLFGRLPAEGESVTHEGYDFQVLEMSGLRIARIRVTKAGQKHLEEEVDANTGTGGNPETGTPETTGDETETPGKGGD